MKTLLKVIKIAMVTLVLASISVLSLSCGSGSSSTAAPTQTATVQRGNLTVAITASGNLALSVTEDLPFEMAGTVEEVMVEEGDSVEEGQVLANLDASEWQTQLVTLQSNLLQAKINLDNANIALEQAEGETTTTATGDISNTTTDPEEIEILQLQYQLAEARYEDAQKALDEANAASPEITAPFAGFITNVNVSGGDEVLKGTVAVTLADPNKFEANILVSEMDINQVKVGGAATVEADAFPGVIIPATVTHISPTATIQSGVVNYSVTVEVQSLESIAQQQAGQGAGGIESPPAGSTPPEGATPPTGGRGTSTGQTMAALEAIQLREGMTVTVNIIVQQATNVLMVPYAAITIEGGKSYVQVVSSTGAIEQREITTGITDYTNTEVTDGLSEGEKVVVPQGTTTTTTSQQQNRTRGGIFFGQ
jgi:macrolide-specific efflux system membrane fusion protein